MFDSKDDMVVLIWAQLQRLIYGYLSIRMWR